MSFRVDNEFSRNVILEAGVRISGWSDPDTVTLEYGGGLNSSRLWITSYRDEPWGPLPKLASDGFAAAWRLEQGFEEALERARQRAARPSPRPANAKVELVVESLPPNPRADAQAKRDHKRACAAAADAPAFAIRTRLDGERVELCGLGTDALWAAALAIPSRRRHGYALLHARQVDLRPLQFFTAMDVSHLTDT